MAVGLAAGLAAVAVVAGGPGPAAARPRSLVAVVRADLPSLAQPVPAGTELSGDQIEGLVRQAVRLAGGLRAAVRADARWVAIKVNIVEVRSPGSGVITDARVVKAVVKLAHEAAPAARISIVEGPGEWVAPDVPAAESLGTRVEDGWQVAGYRALLADPELAGVRLDLVDLNVDEVALTPVPGGGAARQEYWVPRTVLECDALIDVPVMKTIQAVGMTCAMKNFVGIAPGCKYGWPKLGGPQGPGLPHTVQVLDEMIVDLTSLARPAFVVVDAVTSMERAKTDRHGGRARRTDMVVAGRDVVAVDATCARLMGLNPDDIEYLTLAAAKGLGQMAADRVRVVGQPLRQVACRFEKPPMGDIWQEMGHYGQGNRTWLLRGPLPAAGAGARGADLTAGRPRPGREGWSLPVYFGDDRIDLDKHYGDPADCLTYAYAELAVARASDAELWLGSDEGLVVWLDGKEVYRFAGARRHQLPNDRLPVHLAAGRHRLLVEVSQTRGRYAFSLNVCEAEADPRYEGNRLAGARFVLPGQEHPAAADPGQGGLRVDGEEATGPSPGTHRLDGVHWVPNPATLVGSLEGGLRALGDASRPTWWLMGVTGYAFGLSVSDALGWSDPGIRDAGPDPEAAVARCAAAGYRLERVAGKDGAPDARARMTAIWERVTGQLDQRRPAILERQGCYLVWGYDPRVADYLYTNWEGDQQVPFDELAAGTGQFGAIFFGERVPVDTLAVERAALELAVNEAGRPDTPDGRISSGLRAYERWARALEAGTMADAWAHAYHVMLLRAARGHAATFVAALAARQPEPAAGLLRQAAAHYRQEESVLGKMEEQFGFASLGDPQRVRDPEVRRGGAALLRQALAAERQAVARIEEAVRALPVAAPTKATDP